jgi:hypothetical protein
MLKEKSYFKTLCVTMSLTLLVIVIGCISAGSLHAEVVTIEPFDAMVTGYGDNVCDSDEVVLVFREHLAAETIYDGRGFMKFDLSGVPTGDAYTIFDIELGLYYIDAWGESNVNTLYIGYTSDEFTETFTWQEYNGDGADSWTDGNGAGVDPYTFDLPNLIGSITCDPDTTLCWKTLNNDTLTNYIQTQVDSGNDAYLWLAIDDTSTYRQRFYSTEYGDNKEPYLKISHTPMTTTLSGTETFYDALVLAKTPYQPGYKNDVGTYFNLLEYSVVNSLYDRRGFIRVDLSSVPNVANKIVTDATLGIYYTGTSSGDTGTNDLYLGSTTDEFTNSVNSEEYNGSDSWTDGLAAGVEPYYEQFPNYLGSMVVNSVDTGFYVEYDSATCPALAIYLTGQVQAEKNAYLWLALSYQPCVYHAFCTSEHATYPPYLKLSIGIDTAAPVPNPPTWKTEPHTGEISWISMEVDPCYDVAGVEYYFDETSGNSGGSDSGWQDSPYYVDWGLTPGKTYTYRAKAREKGNQNYETSYSTSKSCTTAYLSRAVTVLDEDDIVDAAITGNTGKTPVFTGTVHNLREHSGYPSDYDGRGFMRIDLSSIDTGSQIQYAELGLYYFLAFGGSNEDTLHIGYTADEFTDSFTWETYNGTNSWTDGDGAGVNPGTSSYPNELVTVYCDPDDGVGYKILSSGTLTNYIQTQVEAGKDAYLWLAIDNTIAQYQRFAATEYEPTQTGTTPFLALSWIPKEPCVTMGYNDDDYKSSMDTSTWNIVCGTTSDSEYVLNLKAEGKLFAYAVSFNENANDTNQLVELVSAAFENDLNGALPGGFDAVSLDELNSYADGTYQSDRVVAALEEIRTRYPGKVIIPWATWKHGDGGPSSVHNLSAYTFADKLQAVRDYTDLFMLENYLSEGVQNLTDFASFADNIDSYAPGILPMTCFGLAICQSAPFAYDDTSSVSLWGYLDKQFYSIRNDSDADDMPGVGFWIYYRTLIPEVVADMCKCLYSHYYTDNQTSYFGDGSDTQMLSDLDAQFETGSSGWTLTAGSGGTIATFDYTTEGVTPTYNRGSIYATHGARGLKMVRGSTANTAVYTATVDTDWKYTISAFVMGEDGDGDTTCAKVKVLTSGDVEIASEEFTSVSTAAWDRSIFRFQPTTTTIKIVLCDESDSASAGQTTYWDFIELEEMYNTN